MVDAVGGIRRKSLLTASIFSENRRQGHQVCQTRIESEVKGGET